MPGHDQHGIVDRLALPNYGNRATFPAVPVAGGVQVQGNVQLLSVRPAIASPWTVTLEPATKTGNPGTVPWFASFDGTTAPPAHSGPGTNFSAPVNAPNGYKCILEWGSGGVRQRAVFDYPMAGGSFTVFCDTLDLQVSGADPTQTYAVPTDLPTFGAHMVPGAGGGGRAGMRLNDVIQLTVAPAGTTRFWSVKPHARWLWVSQLTQANAAGLYQVDFDNFAAGVGLAPTTNLGQDAGSTNSISTPIPVPPQATYVALTNRSAADMLWALMWEIELG